MTDRPRSPDPGDDRGNVYDRDSTTGIPRWVKVVGITLAVLALVVVVVLLVGGGGHRPRRHGSGGAGGQAAPSSVTAVHVPPISRGEVIAS
jgi:hypothetical protein